MRTRFLAAACMLSLCGEVHAQSNEELKRMLEQALRTVQDLQSRVQALEAQKAAPAAAAVAAEPAGAPVVAPNIAAEAGTPAADKARVEFYGQVMVDAIHDARRMNPNWQATLRPSQIPVNCPADAGCGKEGAYSMS